MDRTIFLTGFALGLFFVVVYSIQCWRGVHAFSLGVMVMIVLSSAGIVGGAMLVVKFFLPIRLRAQLTGFGFDLYTGIGGLAVLAVSIQRIYREMFAKRNPPP